MVFLVRRNTAASPKPVTRRCTATIPQQLELTASSKHRATDYIATVATADHSNLWYVLSDARLVVRYIPFGRMESARIMLYVLWLALHHALKPPRTQTFLGCGIIVYRPMHHAT